MKKFFPLIQCYRQNTLHSGLKCFHTSSVSKAALNFTEEHDEIRQTIKEIIHNDINPYVDEWEKQTTLPIKEVFKKFGNAGLLGITKEKKYGGLELDYSFTVAFLEELGNIHCYAIPLAISMHTDMATSALSRYGSDELKKEFLAPSIAGDRVSCVGVSEMHCGSNLAAIETKAVRKGDDLVINGRKMWTTSGPQTDWMCLLANTREGLPDENKSLICLPLDLPGISFNRIHKMGIGGSETAQVIFEDVKIPAKYIIGEEGMGFIYQMEQFQEEMMATSLTCLSGLYRNIQETIYYCKDLRVLENKAIQYILAELQCEVEGLKSMIFRAADEKMGGKDVTLLASMVKLKTGRLVREVTDKCLQFWGGIGYTEGARVSRSFRDGRLMSFDGGTDEVMLSIISKHMGILPNTDRCNYMIVKNE